MSTKKAQARLTCQQCGTVEEAEVVIEPGPEDGIEEHHVTLPDGWEIVWVPDDGKAKFTCGECLT